ncbi:MAG TPA: hypothetical protein VF286_02630 [Acidiphilium sp.]
MADTAAPVALTIVAQPLPVVLHEIAAKAGLGLVTSGQLDEQVNDVALSGSPSDALDQLAKLFDFTWFSDTSTIFVSPSTDRRTVVISGTGSDVASINATLQSLGVDSTKWPVQEGPHGNIIVSGPASYVDLIKEISGNTPSPRPSEHAMPRVLHGPVIASP